MSIVTLQQDNSRCEIDTIGCGITQLVLQDQKVLWSGIRPDGGTGFTHPCIPNFNLADGLPNHGPARKAEWQQSIENTFTWKMTEIPEIYQAGLQATRTFTLTQEQLTVVTEIENNGQSSLPINIAEHHYFSCPSELRSQVKVNGKAFDENALNGTALYSPLESNSLIIEIPQHPLIQLKIDGYGAFAQWSLPDAEFVCVEPIQVLPLAPAEFLATAPRLRPGEKKIFTYTVSLTNP